jgi:hypothetical protein
MPHNTGFLNTGYLGERPGETADRTHGNSCVHNGWLRERWPWHCSTFHCSTYHCSTYRTGGGERAVAAAMARHRDQPR